jgi:DNA-directed RNA polymerase specialized sigma24 family protein
MVPGPGGGVVPGTRGDTVTILPELAPIVRTLRGLPAYERAVGCGRLHKELRQAGAAMMAMRRDAIEELRAQGLSLGEVGELLGVSYSKVHQWMHPANRHKTGATRAAEAAGDPPEV